MWIEPKKGEIIKLSTETGEITVSENLVTVALSHDKTLGAKWERQAGIAMHESTGISANARRWWIHAYPRCNGGEMIIRLVKRSRPNIKVKVRLIKEIGSKKEKLPTLEELKTHYQLGAL